MAPAIDVRASVGSFAITNGHLNDFQVQLGSAEQQIKIAERIKVAEIRSIRHQLVVITLANGLRSAKRVPDGLTQQP